MKIGVIGSGQVGEVLADGFVKHGHDVMRGSRDVAKLAPWRSKGWESADMGGAEAARAIEPLCILWCIPGFLNNDWVHAFKMLRR